MLRCRDIVQHADRYLADEMGFWPRLGFKLHLLFCRYCRRYVHHLRVSQEVCRHVPAQDAPAPAEIDAILAKVLPIDSSSLKQ